MTINDIYNTINKFAPFSLSQKLCVLEDCYDNSGIIVNTDKNIDKIIFALDLTNDVINMAVERGAQLIITHHPAIYTPIKVVEGLILRTASLKIGVISCHLNFDVAEFGVDYYFALGLGGKTQKILTSLGENVGYGRSFAVNKTLKEIVFDVEKEFNTKVFAYGDMNRKVTKINSFCGAGLESSCFNSDADLFVSADIKHNLIVEGLNKDKCIIELTHYASENYGFKKIYNKLKNMFSQIECYYCDLKYMI